MKRLLIKLLKTCILIFSCQIVFADIYAPYPSGVKYWENNVGRLYLVSGVDTDILINRNQNYIFYFVPSDSDDWINIDFAEKNSGLPLEKGFVFYTRSEPEQIIKDLVIFKKQNNLYALVAQKDNSQGLYLDGKVNGKVFLLEQNKLEGSGLPYRFVLQKNISYPANKGWTLDKVFKKELKSFNITE